MIQFTTKKHHEEPESDREASSVITWVFQTLVRLTLCLMTMACLSATIYGFTEQTIALNLMLISLLIALVVLLTGLELLAVLLAIAAASKLSSMTIRRKRPDCLKTVKMETYYFECKERSQKYEQRKPESNPVSRPCGSSQIP